MIQLTKHSVQLSHNTRIETLQKNFEETHTFIINNLIAEELKKEITLLVETAHFEEYIHRHSPRNKLVGGEYRIGEQHPLNSLLILLFNRKKFLKIIREITHLDKIKCCSGRVYQFTGSEQCFDTWHSDITDEITNRLLGFSINLSTETYQGGEFKIRHAHSKQIYRSIKHRQWGNGHFFRISKTLSHRVNRVQGPHPRTVFAGWFLNEGGLNQLFI